MEFYTKLKKIMDEKSITAYKLSNDTGIPQTTISSWKKGKLPTIDKLELIVRYFEVSANYLIGIEELDEMNLSQNEKEMLDNFKILPEREQVKMIGILENKAETYKNKSELSYTSETG